MKGIWLHLSKMYSEKWAITKRTSHLRTPNLHKQKFSRCCSLFWVLLVVAVVCGHLSYSLCEIWRWELSIVLNKNKLSYMPTRPHHLLTGPQSVESPTVLRPPRIQACIPEHVVKGWGSGKSLFYMLNRCWRVKISFHEQKALILGSSAFHNESVCLRVSGALQCRQEESI